MNNIELLILNGSPGSGKSTLAETVLDRLREAHIKCALIDVDQISLAYPPDNESFLWRRSFMWKNLKAIWPNYVALDEIKVIIPMVIDDDKSLEALNDAAPCKKLIICKLAAPLEILKRRVSDREPNEYWRERLIGLVDRYNQRSQENPEKYSHFVVSTHNQSIDEATSEIITKLGWL